MSEAPSRPDAPARLAGLTIDVVSDVVCPWCYVGQRRLQQALAMRAGARCRRAVATFQLDADDPCRGARPHVST